ncbi:MAG: nitroreductase [Pseudomonadota bacterium]
MKVSEAVTRRTSVRAFLPDPVPEETIREVLELARRAPSSSNTQPWHVAVLSGDARTGLTEAVLAEARAGRREDRELTHAGKDIDAVYYGRMVDCGKRLYAAAQIERHEKERRFEFALRNWRFFDAPHVMFLSMPRCVGTAYIVDVGVLLQTIMLLLTERGVASCPQGDLSSFPSITRRFADIPPENLIVCGLSFGYADPGSPLNALDMPRAALDDFVSFSG